MSLMLWRSRTTHVLDVMKVERQDYSPSKRRWLEHLHSFNILKVKRQLLTLQKELAWAHTSLMSWRSKTWPHVSLMRWRSTDSSDHSPCRRRWLASLMSWRSKTWLHMSLMWWRLRDSYDCSPYQSRHLEDTCPWCLEGQRFNWAFPWGDESQQIASLDYSPCRRQQL